MAKVLVCLNTGYNKFQSAMRKILYTDYYLVTVSIVTFFGWLVGWLLDQPHLQQNPDSLTRSPYGAVISVLIACAVLLTADDILPLTINIFSAALLVYSDNIQNYIYLWPLIIPFVICCIIFAIKNGRHKFNKGRLFWPFIAVIYAMLIGGAGVMIKQDFIRVIPEFLMLGLGVPAIYLLYNHFLKDDAKRDIPLYFAKSMMYIGLVMCFQLITVITKSNVPIREWYNTAWETGWANRNLIATCLVFTAGMTAYLSTRYRQGWIFIGLSVFQYACLILTFSRGGILFGAISAVLVIAFTFIKAPKKIIHGVYLVIVAFVTLIIYIALKDDINAVFVSLLDRGFGTSGRDVLYKEAIELFKAHPLFGVGRGYLGPNYKLNSVGVYWFHSTVLQVAATMGIVGLAAYAYYYYVRFAILFKNFKYSFNLFCLAIFVGFEGYSLINVGTMRAYPCMMLVVVMVLLMERIPQDYSGYVTPYNYSTPWGGIIAEKEHAFAEKIRAKYNLKK